MPDTPHSPSIQDGGSLIWANHTAGVRTVDQERAESADRVRTALGLTLANQVVEGRSPDDLVVAEYRRAIHEHHQVTGGADYGTVTDPSPALDPARSDAGHSQLARLGRMG